MILNILVRSYRTSTTKYLPTCGAAGVSYYSLLRSSSSFSPFEGAELERE